MGITSTVNAMQETVTYTSIKIATGRNGTHISHSFPFSFSLMLVRINFLISYVTIVVFKAKRSCRIAADLHSSNTS